MTEQLKEKLADTVVVTINPDGTLDPDTIVLSKEHGDRILWVSNADFPCDMVFTGGLSPFKEQVFHVDQKGWKNSDQIVVEPNENFRFHFDAQPAGRGTVAAADPDVIIKK